MSNTTDTKPPVDDFYCARCVCGWTGISRTNERQAVLDQKDHTYRTGHVTGGGWAGEVADSRAYHRNRESDG